MRIEVNPYRVRYATCSTLLCQLRIERFNFFRCG